jgi:hypothetical protein
MGHRGLFFPLFLAGCYRCIALCAFVLPIWQSSGLDYWGAAAYGFDCYQWLVTYASSREHYTLGFGAGEQDWGEEVADLVFVAFVAFVVFVAWRQPDGTRCSAHVLRIWPRAKSSPFTSLRIVRRRADAGERSGVQTKWRSNKFRANAWWYALQSEVKGEASA